MPPLIFTKPPLIFTRPPLKLMMFDEFIIVFVLLILKSEVKSFVPVQVLFNPKLDIFVFFILNEEIK